MSRTGGVEVEAFERGLMESGYLNDGIEIHQEIA